MPVVAYPLEDLGRYVGEALDRDRTEALLDQLGCDVSEFTELRRLRCRRCAALAELSLSEPLPAACPECGAAAAGEAAGLFEEVGRVEVVRMDLLPVRPDLFDPASLARALRGLLGREVGPPRYELAPPAVTVTVDPALHEPTSFRPHIGCAVVRGLTIDDVLLRQVMKLQELLHWALGRDRKLASIGVYDLARVGQSVRYHAVDPDTFSFVPLQSPDGRPMTARQILSDHPKGVAYAHLLAEHARYPVLQNEPGPAGQNEAGQVLSMPPIINSEETRLTTATRDVFIDVTGVVPRSVDRALNILVAALLELFPGARAEAVTIVQPTGAALTPDLRPQRVSLDVAAAARLVGVDLTDDEAAGLLRRMRHGVALEAPGRLAVDVPAWRNDIMHEVDLFEDLAIAYDYNRITPRLVPSMTVARERPERVVANRARAALTGLGFFETMSLMLTNTDDHYGLLDLADPGDAVLVAHPISVEQTMLRTTLLPGLLKLFAANRGQGLPQRLCEVDDVVRLVPGHEEPAEALHVAAGLLATTAGFADARALAESLGRELGLALTFAPGDHPGFLPGRVARVLWDDIPLGVCGEVHPAVLERLRLVTPLVALELDLQPLVTGPRVS
jgi:phenylalanyl-tRNA synthetase beta chain